MASQLAVSILNQLVGDSPAAKAFFPLLFPLLLILLLLPYLISASRTSTKLPPSPPGGLPLIGHLHLVGAIPHVSLRRLARHHPRCGDFMTIHLGAVPTVVASSPRAAQALLRTHELAFSSRLRTTVGDLLTYGGADIAFEPYGEQWRQSKKLVITHLLSATKVRSYRAARREEVELVVDQIRSAAAGGATVDMSRLLSKFTNDVVCHAVAGKSFWVEGRDLVFRDLLDQTLAFLGAFNLENSYPCVAKVAGGVLLWPTLRTAQRLRDRWDDILDRLIDLRMSKVGVAATSTDDDDKEEDQHERDLLHVLLSVQQEYGLTRDRIKGIILNMVAAATDTTYAALEFAMAELMLHPDVMAKLQADVRKNVPHGQDFVTEDDLVGMAYLKAVLKETLRLHPSTPLLPRVSYEDCVVDGYTIPAGMPVIVNASAIGRDPVVWDAAEEFMPERFIHMGDTACDFRGMNFQFVPFGSGRRMCPGINFATIAIEIMLANLMFHFDWELPSSVDTIDMAEVFKLTACRKEKLAQNKISDLIKLRNCYSYRSWNYIKMLRCSGTVSV